MWKENFPLNLRVIPFPCPHKIHPLFQVLITLYFQFPSSYSLSTYINVINVCVAMYHC